MHTLKPKYIGNFSALEYDIVPGEVEVRRVKIRAEAPTNNNSEIIRKLFGNYSEIIRK